MVVVLGSRASAARAWARARRRSMSVVDLTNTSGNNADDLHHFVSRDLAHKCFYCGGSLTRVAVLWEGYVGEILLHAGCAKDLALLLAKDGFNAGQIELGRQVTV